MAWASKACCQGRVVAEQWWRARGRCRPCCGAGGSLGAFRVCFAPSYLGRIGVKRKKLRGEITTTSYSSVSMTCSGMGSGGGRLRRLAAPAVPGGTLAGWFAGWLSPWQGVLVILADPQGIAQS